MQGTQGGQQDPNQSQAGMKEKKGSLLGGTIAEKFGGSSKDILEEE